MPQEYKLSSEKSGLTMVDAADGTTRPPYVSLLVPMRNEADNIGRCLDSVLRTDYPRNRIEVLVIDGMSDDCSGDVVRRYARQHEFIRLLTNPKRIQATALNLGIREAQGEIILRLDAHSIYEPSYIDRCVTLLQHHQASSVGGVQHPLGIDLFSRAVALAMSTPLAVGDAKFRYSQRELWVDTVYLGAWRKETLERIGGFNEAWKVNEDYELNARLRKSGGGILFSPAIRSSYYVRDSLLGLARQYFRYGYWRVRTIKRHANALRWRHTTPPALVMGLAASLVSILWWWPLGTVIPAVYGLFVLLASLKIAGARKLGYLPLLPVVLATLHVSWGLGFCAGLLRWGIPRRSPATLVRAMLQRDMALDDPPSGQRSTQHPAA